MEYKDIIFRDDGSWQGYRNIPFRYRYDPVPGVHVGRWNFGKNYRTGHNLQERKRYKEDSSYKYRIHMRGSHCGVWLEPWDDNPKSRYINSCKTWKLKKLKRQWMKNMNKHIDNQYYFFDDRPKD